MPEGVREDDQRPITITAPKNLMVDIDALAASDSRSRLNWTVRELSQFLARKKQDSIHVLPTAATKPPQYKTRRAATPKRQHGKDSK